MKDLGCTLLGSVLSGHPRRAYRQLRAWMTLVNPKTPLRLHIGCGQRRLVGFINVDINNGSVTDFVGSAARLPCPDCSVERIETYHVIEHIPFPEVRGVLTEWKRVLRTEGVLVMECPNLDEAMTEYLSGNLERLYSVFGRHRFTGDAHCWGYNGETLTALVESVGFRESEVLAPEDYHKEFEPCIRVQCRK